MVTKDTDDVTGEDPRFPSTPDIPSLLAATPDRKATLEMVQRGAIAKDGNGYTDYALDVVQGDGSVTVGDVVEWTIVNMYKGAPGEVVPQDTTHFHLQSRSAPVWKSTSVSGVMTWPRWFRRFATPPRHRADIMKTWRSTPGEDEAVNLISAQVAATSKGDGVDYDVGDWRDTITLPTPERHGPPAADYDGPSLAHCHRPRTRTWACVLGAFSIQPAA